MAGKNFPVCESLTWATCSGVPDATKNPPSSPPSGPMSMIQSAILITSRLCSMINTVLPWSLSLNNTSNSFLTATIAQEIYGSNKGVPAYVLACITGLSRIHDNKHYVSDVIFGAALGMAIGKGFAQVYRNNVSGKISILPLANQSRIQLVWHF